MLFLSNFQIKSMNKYRENQNIKLDHLCEFISLSARSQSIKQLSIMLASKCVC